MKSVKFKGSNLRYINSKDTLVSAYYRDEEIRVAIDEAKAFSRKNEIWSKYGNFCIFFYENLFFLDDMLSDTLMIYSSNKKSTKDMLKYIKYNFDLNKSEYLELKKMV